ncbi:aldehyde-activating protein [Rhodanobacter sp. C05]|nr:aldehyde-activating protein [Rhodanobacter sp. C05]
MPSLNNAFVFRGGCHCGQLHVTFSTALDPASIVPRACDCSFCQKHGAAYVSDPAGQLSVIMRSPGALRRYRQGSNTAEFLLCDRCGVLVAVVFEQNARIYGAVNARSLEGPTGFGSAAPSSPQLLAPGEKVARWSQLWVPDVELITSGT